MVVLQNIENKLAGAFKDLPQLSASSKEALAKFWPWLALIAGIVQLLAALTLWRLLRLGDVTNDITLYYSGVAAGPSAFDKTVIYLGVAMLVVDAVILLIAYPHLKRRAKQGWDLLFLGTLVYAAYSVLQIFTYQRGIGDFIFGLLGSAIGFYLLFQVREKFGGKRASSKTPHAT